MVVKWIASVSLAVLAAQAALVTAQEAAVQTVAGGARVRAARRQGAEQRAEFRTLDEDVQDLKKQVLDLNRDLFLLEEELLFPSNTQTAVFISMDVGEFFGLDSVELKIDDKDVANYLYTEREADALLKGGVQRLFIGNLKAGEHELVAVFTGEGPHTRDYRRARIARVREGHRPEVHRAHDLGSRDQAAAGVRRQGVGVAGGGSPPPSWRQSALALPAADAAAARDDDDGIVVAGSRLRRGPVRVLPGRLFHGADAPARRASSAVSSRITAPRPSSCSAACICPTASIGSPAKFSSACSQQSRGARRCTTARGSSSRRSGSSAAICPKPKRRSRASRGELPEELEPERQMLHAQVLMEQGRFADALAALEAWRRPGDAWVGYAKYNIGVSLVRLGQVEDGARVLDEVGQLDPENPEFDALRDKANVALGYAWLQASRPVEAKPSLQRVRLDGPFSNKALLGVGWSDAEAADYRAALAPWLALRERSLLDSAVQESLLAVPYAFAQLGADKQAADHYVDAIEAFSSEIVRLTESIESDRERRADHASCSASARTSRTRPRAGTGGSSAFPTPSRAAISTSSWRATASRKGSRTIATCCS